VRAAEFDWMGVFAYSDVETAGSYNLDKKIDPEIVAERRNRLMAIQRPISARRLRRFVGTQVTAIVDGPSQDTPLVWEARIQGMAPEIDGKVFLTDLLPPAGTRAARPGDMVAVQITESHDYDLVGRVMVVQEFATAPSADLATPVRRIATGAPLRILA
jgi:ribosomal protein S12 methylthiotransferase